MCDRLYVTGLSKQRMLLPTKNGAPTKVEEAKKTLQPVPTKAIISTASQESYPVHSTS